MYNEDVLWHDKFAWKWLQLKHFFYISPAYRTVAGVNGPLVILDQVKVS